VTLEYDNCLKKGKIKSSLSREERIYGSDSFDDLSMLEVFGKKKISLRSNGSLKDQAIPKRKTVLFLQIDGPKDTFPIVYHRGPGEKV